MFDAVNAIEGGYDAYRSGLADPQGASPEAATAAAAHHVASQLYPEADELEHWNASLAESLASISDGDAKELGIAFGNSVGEAMLAARAGDGSLAVVEYTPGSQPGDSLLGLAFLVFSMLTVAREGLLQFWSNHTVNMAGNQVWFDLVIAVTLCFYLIVPRARAVQMSVIPWAIAVILTASIALLPMLARLIWLEQKTSNGDLS